MELGVTSKHNPDCCNIGYPAELNAYNTEFYRTGVSVVQQHLIRARYFTRQHPPPRDNYELLLTDIRHSDFWLAKLILVKTEAYPGWQPNTFQCDYITNYAQQLADEPRCIICGLFEGPYCSQPCPPSPTPRNSYTGQNSYRLKKKNLRKAYRKKNSKPKTSHSPEKETQDSEHSSEAQDHPTHDPYRLRTPIMSILFTSTRNEATSSGLIEEI